MVLVIVTPISDVVLSYITSHAHKLTLHILPPLYICIDISYQFDFWNMYTHIYICIWLIHDVCPIYQSPVNDQPYKCAHFCFVIGVEIYNRCLSMHCRVNIYSISEWIWINQNKSFCIKDVGNVNLWHDVFDTRDTLVIAVYNSAKCRCHIIQGQARVAVPKGDKHWFK